MAKKLACYMILSASLFTVFMLVISFRTHIFIVLSHRNHHESAASSPVAGEDETDGLVFDNLRGVLGLNLRRLRYKEIHKSFVPAPSPSLNAHSEAPSPAPAPVLALSPHSRPPQPSRARRFAPRGTSEHNGGGGSRKRKMLVAVFVSVGCVNVLIFAGIGLGLFCFHRKFRRHGKSWPLTLKGRHKDRSGLLHVSPLTSVGSNVGLNPKMDLFHFESLNTDLEQDPVVKSVSFDNFSTEKAFPSKYETGHYQLMEVENVSCSATSTREILSVHGSTESIVGYESECGDSASVSGGGNGTIIPGDFQGSSEDETFHSVNSNSSSFRLSSASANSLSEPVASSSPRQGPIPPPPPPPPPRLFASPETLPASKFVSNKMVKVNTCSDSHSDHPEPIRANVPPPPPPPQLKTPPPTPPVLSNFIHLGENGSPLPKLKPLHWDKVRAEPDKSMVWDKFKSSSFKLDEEMIESLFGYNLKSSGTDDKSKSKSPSPSKHVLEPKRLQNITILSKALNITADQVCHALLLGNGLSLQQLEALVKMVPTIDEANKLSKYKGDINELGSAEKFVKTIICVPFAFCRIEAMLYRETFEDEVAHLKKSFSVLEDSCMELRSSRLFLKLLEAVLKTGNRMNVGTFRGGAQAFKLDALLKLSDIKGTDGKTTLLHFVVQEMVRSEGHKEAKTIVGRMNQRSRSVEEREEHYKKMGLELISSLSNELTNVKKTASIDLEALASSVSNLTHGMAELRKLIDDDMVNEEGGFVEGMRFFLGYGEKALKELEEEEGRVLKLVKEITEYFHGENLSKEDVNHLRIFVIVRDFLGMLDVVCKELKTLKTSPGVPNPLAPFRLS